MQRNKGQGTFSQTTQRPTMPCCVNIVTALATPVQRQAWACLWRTLLMEDIDHNRRRAREIEGETHEM